MPVAMHAEDVDGFLLTPSKKSFKMKRAAALRAVLKVRVEHGPRSTHAQPMPMSVCAVLRRALVCMRARCMWVVCACALAADHVRQHREDVHLPRRLRDRGAHCLAIAQGARLRPRLDRRRLHRADVR